MKIGEKTDVSVKGESPLSTLFIPPETKRPINIPGVSVAIISLARGERCDYHVSVPSLRASLSNQTCGVHPRPTFFHTSYDVWGNRTGGEQRFWRLNQSTSVQRTFTNNRDGYTQYDAEGYSLANQTDAAGRLVGKISIETVGGGGLPVEYAFEIGQKFDGNGNLLQRTEVKRRDEAGPSVSTQTSNIYFLNSTVLGGKPVAKIEASTATKTEGYIYANGALIAKQMSCTGCNPSTYIEWHETNPITGERADIHSTGGGGVEHRDPMGANTGDQDPYLDYVDPSYLDLIDQQPLYLESDNNPFDPNSPFQIDGIPVSPEEFRRRTEGDSVMGQATYGTNSPQYFSLKNNIFWSGGSFSVLVPGNNNAPTPPGGNPEMAYGTRDTIETFYFAYSQKRQRGPSAPAEGEGEWDSVCNLSGLNIPDFVDLRDNIAEAERHRLTGPTISGFLIPWKGIADVAGDYSKAQWFENHVRSAFGRIDDVRNAKSWDYKQLDPAKYESFGNFNYGLTGAAVGFQERLLLRMAGRANLADMPADQRARAERLWGTSGNIFTDPRGGTKTFGDEPKDQYWIRKGYQYYMNNCGSRK